MPLAFESRATPAETGSAYRSMVSLSTNNPLELKKIGLPLRDKIC
jgi:hypothetical protein